jgi:hypothetical protein
MRWAQMVEDTAGNCWWTEFEAGSTAPVRQWVERPRRVYIPTGDFSPEQLYIIDYQWEITQDCDNHLLST